MAINYSEYYVLSDNPVDIHEKVLEYECPYCKNKSTDFNTYIIDGKRYCCLLCYSKGLKLKRKDVAKKEALEREKETLLKRVVSQYPKIKNRKISTLSPQELKRCGFNVYYAIVYYDDEDEQELGEFKTYSDCIKKMGRLFEKLSKEKDKEFSLRMELKICDENNVYQGAFSRVWNYTREYVVKTKTIKKD